MTRRTGVIAALATVAGAMTQDQSYGTLVDTAPKPHRLEIHLGKRGFVDVTVIHGTRSVVLTADEIMDALEGK